MQVSPGRVLCTEGDIGHECFVVIEGEAIVTAAGLEIARILKGGLFGEMSVLDGRPGSLASSRRRRWMFSSSTSGSSAPRSRGADVRHQRDHDARVAAAVHRSFVGLRAAQQRSQCRSPIVEQLRPLYDTIVRLPPFPKRWAVGA